MTHETANPVESTPDKAGSDRANHDALSRWTNEGGAPAPSENATESAADTTWFVPPIVVPALLVLIVIVRVLALAY